MISRVFYLVVFIFSFISMADVTAQDNKDMEAGQKAWMEYMTPGDAHKLLAESVGEWKMITKMYMDPSAPPQVSEGTCTNEMILGGRYLKSVQKGNMMGMPFEGIMHEAYDNITKEYISTWIDNFGTGLMVSKGTYDKATGMFNFKGKAVDPMVGKEMEIKEVLKIVSKNKHILEMFTVVGDKEIKTMEVEYTRP